MCGIFGIVLRPDSGFSRGDLEKTTRRLFQLSESRGKEAAGLALFAGDRILVHKAPVPASVFINQKSFRDLLDIGLYNGLTQSSTAVIGHSRLVTNGFQTVHKNNQPIIAKDLVGVHNGIIVNDAELWSQFPSLTRQGDVDTEALLSIIWKLTNDGLSITEATAEAFRRIQGSASIAVFVANEAALLLCTNTGSLYQCCSESGAVSIFASEAHILQQLVRNVRLRHLLGDAKIKQLPPGQGRLIDLSDLSEVAFDIWSGSPHPKRKIGNTGRVRKIIETGAPKADLRRCSKCILPETMPFIEFDDSGVCNLCRTHQKFRPKGLQACEEVVSHYRTKQGDPDCVVLLSGGRDSCYGLHYVKKVLRMNPIAYSYDWGMLTDLGRRNQARMCGKLGVEHIVVSADITTKRRHIRKNIQAWLKKPELGMVPLFMAGDKQYFYYANKVMRDTGIKLLINCENPLEKTRFKHGFCGVNEGAARVFNLSWRNKLRLVAYYVRQYLRNPAYFNGSLWDTLFAFRSTYFTPHEHFFLYQYIGWNEEEVVKTLVEDYDWEIASDTASTWRIGDGTASFYNYIYGTMAGFTENDTFRSNQIREGLYSREEALRSIIEENKPRMESLQWYAQTIGFDLHETLSIINAAPKRY